MKHHTFTDVKLKEDFVNKLSGGTKELLKETETEDPNDKDNKIKSYITESLKYAFPEIPKKKGLQPRPMTPDQKLMNTIFMREVKRVWQEAAVELESQIEAAKAAGGRVTMPTSCGRAAAVWIWDSVKRRPKVSVGMQKQRKIWSRERRQCRCQRGADNAAQASAAAAPKDGKGDDQIDDAKLTLKILNAILIKRLSDLLEEDEDRSEDAKKEAEREKRMEAKKRPRAFRCASERH